MRNTNLYTANKAIIKLAILKMKNIYLYTEKQITIKLVILDMKKH